MFMYRLIYDLVLFPYLYETIGSYVMPWVYLMFFRTSHIAVDLENPIDSHMPLICSLDHVISCVMVYMTLNTATLL